MSEFTVKESQPVQMLGEEAGLTISPLAFHALQWAGCLLVKGNLPIQQDEGEPQQLLAGTYWAPSS